MSRTKQQIIMVFAITAAALVMSGCVSSSVNMPQSQEYSSTRGHAHRWGGSVEKYTKTDYDFLLAFRTDGYESLSVEEFNRRVMDWDEEEAYHKTEDILSRVFATLSEEDENADFILITLGNTWNECEKKHYNTCEREKSPWHSGYAECETYGDVFGDKVRLTGGYAEFGFDYNLDTSKSLTVGQRDDLLDSISTKLEAYMKEQPAGALKQEETMKKALAVQLEDLLNSMDEGIIWGGNSDISYYWDAPYEAVEDTVAQAAEATSEGEYIYTKKQYNLVMEQLKPENYEQMSVSEYNRTINKAFSEDTKDEDGMNFAYEMVVSTLSEKDENWDYLHGTVQRALDEYQTRTREVYTGKNTDFSSSGDIHIPLMEDVFGDQMEVGGIEGAYVFTYRIKDADKLTVKGREDFIKSVNQKAKESVEKEMKTGTVDKAGFKALLETAGKESGNEYIEFTGCTLEFFEVYR